MARGSFKNKHEASEAGKKSRRGPSIEKRALRQAITAFIENNYDTFEKELLKLKGKEFIDRMLNLLEYATPKLNRTDIGNADGEDFNFRVLDDDQLRSIIGQLADEISQKGSSK